ncbi:MAG: hypothetical protein GY947_07500 [Rhodobacteraceae bacterium]|nr:hypothetical protein [Paracoccaceae bacterium]
MSVHFQSPYTLPGADQPLTHARIAHRKNWCDGTVVVNNTSTGFFADAPNNALTYEKWRARDLITIDDPTTWVQVNGATAVLPVAAHYHDLPVYAFTEDAALGVVHNARFVVTDSVDASSQSITFYARGQLNRDIRVRYRDPSLNSHTADIDMQDGAVNATSGMTALVRSLGGDWYQINVTFLPAVAGTGGDVTISALKGGVTTYNGDSVSGVQFTKPVFARSINTWELQTWQPQTIDYCCIAGHNLGDWGGTLQVQVDDGAGGYTTVIDQVISDNEPIYCIFEPQTGDYFRVKLIDSNPEIAVIRFGTSMQMPHAIYGGHEPLKTARKTTMRSNVSSTGEWLGRTRQRTLLATPYSWNLLSADFVRTQWEPFQRASEDEPFFLAWRPGEFSEAGYCSVDGHTPPANTGVAGFMSGSLQVKGYSNG